MDNPDPPLVTEPLVDSAERSLVDDIRQLAADGRTLIEAELAWQKSRAALAGQTVKGMAGWLALALSLIFFALMALVMGLLLALTPLLTGWGAMAVVVLALLGGAAGCGWLAMKRWKRMEATLKQDDAA